MRKKIIQVSNEVAVYDKWNSATLKRESLR